DRGRGPRPLVQRAGRARVRLRRPHPCLGSGRHGRRRHGQPSDRQHPEPLIAGEQTGQNSMTTPMFGGTAFGQGEAPSSRYILPSFEERTAYGYKRQDPYAKLFEDRIVFLGVQIDDASAVDIMAQLLVLERQDLDRDIIMYINSPGGSF